MHLTSGTTLSWGNCWLASQWPGLLGGLCCRPRDHFPVVGGPGGVGRVYRAEELGGCGGALGGVTGGVGA